MTSPAPPTPTRVAVLGLGLIGGSLLQAAARTRLDAVGYDPDPDTAHAAAETGHQVADSAADAAHGAELVVLAMALPDLPAALDEVAGVLLPGTIVTDVGTLKSPVLAAVGSRLAGARFVGGHPLAGTELSGWDAADPLLFRDAPWALTLEPDTDLGAWLAVAGLVCDLGARPIPARAGEQDAAVARVIGLPHVLAEALALTGLAGGPLGLSLAAGSYRSGSRVARTRPELVATWCDGNPALVEALDDVLARLAATRQALAGGGSVLELASAGHRARTDWEDRRVHPVEVRADRGRAARARGGRRVDHGRAARAGRGDAARDAAGVSPHPVLVEVVRGALVESVHRGSVVVLAADGSVASALGTVDAPMYPRSCAKPLQASVLHHLGFDGPPEWLALAASSHSGEPRHVALVRQVLASAGLEEDALQCPPDLPWDRPLRTAGPTRIEMNCSGKHAAMLTTCVAQGWPVETYLDPGHPLQAAVRDGIGALAGEPVPTVSVDGCGAPLVALTLTGLARAVQRMDADLAAAMAAHPDVVGGTGRRVSALMQAAPGVVVKDGADGVYVLRLPDGRTAALKIDDGAARAADVAAGAVLRRLGRDVPVETPVLGGGHPVGVVRPAAALA